MTADLERVARAIGAAYNEAVWGDPTFRDYQLEIATAMARAAVAALREPSEAMISAANAACDEYGQVMIKSGWKAMIDRILKGE